MSGYTVRITPAAWKEIKRLPGNIRQRLRRALQALAENPRPANSKELEVADAPIEARRLRIDQWRIVYGVTDADASVDVLAVRKRPPYDYADLASLLKS